jgi:hypothetical protein
MKYLYKVTHIFQTLKGEKLFDDIHPPTINSTQEIAGRHA